MDLGKMDIFDKCFAWEDAKFARATGSYPYFPAIQENHSSRVVIEGRTTVMVGSNNYLGLSTDPRVKQAAVDAINKFGSTCSGSRLLNGTLDLHEQLERRLAKFLNKEAALTFSTGFQTNQGTLVPLLGRNDIIFADRDNHASIVDGARLSLASLQRYRHNNISELDRMLGLAPEKAGKLIVVDGVFSMEGDVANLPEIARLKRQYGARLMVDDAHGVGVLGPGGRGTSEHFGVEDDVDLLMTTFSKSFASLGGVLAGPQDVIDYIKHKSRALIFSASIAPASVGACLASLDIIENEPERREQLWKNTEKMRAGFRSMGFDTGPSTTPVIPIMIGDDKVTFFFWRALLDAGVYACPVICPAVAPGHQLIRTSVMATHTDEQIDLVLSTFEKLGRQFGLIGTTRLAAAGAS